MNKELAQKVLEMLTAAEGFVLEQAPDVVQQLLVWQFWSSVVGFVICLVVFFVCAWAVWRLFKSADNYGPDPVIIIPSVAVIISTLIGCISFFNALQIHLAPKVFLLEYLRGIVK